MKKRILLDCDGVLADFCAACFDLIEQHTGDRHTHDEVKQWDLFDALGKGHLKHLLKDAASDGGWCLGIPVFKGAQDGVRRLEQLGEVVIVTSPMTTPFWAYERTIWLQQHFGIPKNRIVHTEGKLYVDGDVFIDDADDNCVSWNVEHPNAQTILWDAPYNRSFSATNDNFVRCTGWDEVIRRVEMLMKKRHESDCMCKSCFGM